MKPVSRPATLVLATMMLAASILAAPVAAGGVTVRPAPGKLRVMTFNVRLSAAEDGENAWTRRTGLFFKTIHDFGPDLVGFQEVLADQYEAMIAQLPGFGFSGVARDDGKRRGEWSLVGFRRDRFTAVDQGDFWLSEQPAVAGSKSWDAALTRLCSWVRLRENATGREFVFANTHFDHRGVIARREASRLIARELARIAGDLPAILTGDLNVTEDDPAYANLVAADQPGATRWIDAYRATHPTRQPDELTYHAFLGGTRGDRIDYIFHTAHFTATEAAIDRSASADGHFPSDHYPVTAVLQATPPAG